MIKVRPVRPCVVRVALALLLVGLVASCTTTNPDLAKEHDNGFLSEDCGPVFLTPDEPSSWRVERRFFLRNPSQSCDMHLRLQSRSCGCANVVIYGDKVGPGDMGQVSLSFDLHYQRERRREQAVVATGLAELPAVVVSLSAEAYPRLTMVSGALDHIVVAPGKSTNVEVAFAAFQPEREVPEAIEVTCHGRGLSLHSLTPGPEATALGVRERTVHCVVSVSCPERGGGQLGEHSGYVEVQTGPWRMKKKVTWKPRRYVVANPSRVFLRASATSDDEITIELCANIAFTIKNVEADDARIECSGQLGNPGIHHDIKVQWNGGASTKLAEMQELRVMTDHPFQRIVRIPVFVFEDSVERKAE